MAKSKISHYYDIINKRYGFEESSYDPVMVNFMLIMDPELTELGKLLALNPVPKQIHYDTCFYNIRKGYRVTPKFIRTPERNYPIDLLTALAYNRNTTIAEAEKVIEYYTDDQLEEFLVIYKEENDIDDQEE